MVSVKGGRIPSGSRREPGDGATLVRKGKREGEKEKRTGLEHSQSSD